jgi:hypothetical protein
MVLSVQIRTKPIQVPAKTGPVPPAPTLIELVKASQPIFLLEARELMSAFGGKADMTLRSATSAFDPKRTIQLALAAFGGECRDMIF